MVHKQVTAFARIAYGKLGRSCKDVVGSESV